MTGTGGALRYLPPPMAGGLRHQLVYSAGEREQRFPFDAEIEIGRGRQEVQPPPGKLFVDDGTVSRRHCIVTCGADGRFHLRDLSSNGTWLDGRRLAHGLEIEIRPGQEIRVATGFVFRLESMIDEPPSDLPGDSFAGTVVVSNWGLATILVGDIRGYTGLTRQAPLDALQQSVQRVFRVLGDLIVGHGGTIKEYQGDALLAYWDYSVPGIHAETACRAALALDAEVARIAGSPEIWNVPGFELGMDWAITTGKVSMQNFRGDHLAGLSMIGEPLVLAFRLEKKADDRTGPILVCATTKAMVGDRLSFNDVGSLSIEGFEEPVRAYALVREGDAGS